MSVPVWIRTGLEPERLGFKTNFLPFGASPFETGSHCIVWASLELEFILSAGTQACDPVSLISFLMLDMGWRTKTDMTHSHGPYSGT